MPRRQRQMLCADFMAASLAKVPKKPECWIDLKDPERIGLCQEPSKYNHEAANACQFFSIK